MREIARQPEHHGEDMLRHGIGEDRGRFGEDGAPGAKVLEECIRMITGIPRAAEVNPSEAPIVHAISRRRLAEGDVGLRERRIPGAFDQDGRIPHRGKNQAMTTHALLQPAHRRLGKRGIGPDRQRHGSERSTP